MAEEVHGECRPVGERDLRPDVPPEEGAGPKAMDEQHGGSPMTIAFDVHRPWTNGDAQQVGVDWWYS
ncbi:hypothetical protein D3C83_117870 [compost metagenome]